MSTSTTSTLDETRLCYTPRITIHDPVFLQGLSSILAPYYERNAEPDEIQQVTDRAESFYLASPQPDNPASDRPAAHADSPLASSLDSPSSTAATSTESDQPPYPLSFAHLAQLIATGAPIPGIRDIPDKVTEERPSESTRPIQRKPWERANLEAEQDEHDHPKETEA
ncbi:hypothetical protein JCM3766R1_000638 [Sporobolomyces carnicolor]